MNKKRNIKLKAEEGEKVILKVNKILRIDKIVSVKIVFLLIFLINQLTIFKKTMSLSAKLNMMNRNLMSMKMIMTKQKGTI